MFTLTITKHFTLEMSLSTAFLQVGSKEFWFSCVDHNTGETIRPTIVTSTNKDTAATLIKA